MRTKIIVWLFMTAFFGGTGAVVIVPRMLDYYWLSRTGQATHGQVIAARPHVHNTCQYRFMVQGRAFEATGRGCGSACVGDTITIYFDPLDPSRSTNGDPFAAFINELVSFGAALVLFPLFAAYCVRRPTAQP